MPGWVELLSCLPYWPVSLFAPEWMLDLSSGLRQHPFFALAGRYYISEAPLSLSYFAFHIFHFLLFHCLIAAPSVWIFLLFWHHLALRFPLSYYIFFPVHFFFARDDSSSFGCSMSFLPSWSFLLSLPLWYLTPLYLFCFFPQAKRSQAVCPDPSVPVNALA